MTKKEIFLCHDVSDKDIVDVIYKKLRSKRINPWLYTTSVNLRDNIINKMNEGLKNCKYILIILSPSFIKNSGWARQEFEAAFHLLINSSKFLLPVWRGIGVEEIKNYHQPIK